MNNRYLYRAKRIDNGEWVEGFYAVIENEDVIIVAESEHYYTEDGESNHGNEVVEIDPQTICQCTGLKDKNGKLIWENDVISINAYSYEEPEETVVGVVKYSEANTGFCLDDGDPWIPICEIYGSYLTEYFVVGNIFDNPELMEQEG